MEKQNRGRDVIRNFGNQMVTCVTQAWQRMVQRWRMFQREPCKKNNAVHTSKYTVWSFLPKCFFYQFSRFSNVYFLCIGVMQLFPSISDSDGIPTTLTPLAIVIVVSALKDVVEDLRRHRADAEENNRPVKLCKDGEVVTTTWKHLHVGDIIKVERNDAIPADLVLLGASGFAGVCYVETKNLDGETSLKRKIALPQIARFFQSDEVATRMKVSVVCGPPSATLYEFDGTVEEIRMKRIRRCSSSRDSNTSNDVSDDRSVWLEPPLRPPTLDTPLMSPESTNKSCLKRPREAFPLQKEDSVFGVDTVWNPDQPCNQTETSERVDRAESSRHINHQHYPDLSRQLEPTKVGHATFRHAPDGVNEDSLVVLTGPLRVDVGQFFLRGSSLVNTEWIYGLVVYVSNDTRIFQNANTQTQFKWSHLEKTYNRHVLTLVVLEVIFCLIICVGAVVYRRVFKKEWYLRWPAQSEASESAAPTTSRAPPASVNDATTDSEAWQHEYLSTLQVFGSMIILFAYFVPIDLFLMLEIVRLVQGVFVAWDQEMQGSTGESNTSRTTSQSSHLLEELGNITHLFTDKTGTLTRNVMTLRCVSVSGAILRSFYTLVSSEDATQAHIKMKSAWGVLEHDPALDGTPKVVPSRAEVFQHSGTRLKLQNRFSAFSLRDWELQLEMLRMGTSGFHTARLFFLNLAVCHTVLIRDRTALGSTDRCCCPSALPLQTSEVPLPSFLTPEHVRIVSKRHQPTAEWVVDNPPLAEYDASSPDELALVSGAQGCGIEFYCRTQLNRIQLRLLTPLARKLILGPTLNALWEDWVAAQLPQTEQDENGTSESCPAHSGLNVAHIWVPLVTLELLDVLEFDNDRKRMSVIIRDPILFEHQNNGASSSGTHSEARHLVPATSVLRLLTKGADSQILSVVAAGEDAHADLLAEHINRFADEGFRTLALACRVLDSAEYEAFNRQFMLARSQAFPKTAVSQYAGSQPMAESTRLTIAALLNSLEKDLGLVGATGVEDQLQDEVPLVIRDLRSCGIHCWVLTGDKPETAINVGHSTHLLTDHTMNYVLEETCPHTLKLRLESLWKECEALGFLGAKTTIFCKQQHQGESARNVSSRSDAVTGSPSTLFKKGKRMLSSAFKRVLKAPDPSSCFTSVDSEEFFRTVPADDQFAFSEWFSTGDPSLADGTSRPGLDRGKDNTPSRTCSVSSAPSVSASLPFFRQAVSELDWATTHADNQASAQHPQEIEYQSDTTQQGRHPNDRPFGEPDETSGRIDGIRKSVWRSASYTTTARGDSVSSPLKTTRRQSRKRKTRTETCRNTEFGLPLVVSALPQKDYHLCNKTRLTSSPTTVRSFRMARENFLTSRFAADSPVNHTKGCTPPSIEQRRVSLSSAKEFSITVTGSVLDVILKRKPLTLLFYRLARRAAVVIACRVTPKQKALLVKQSSMLNPLCTSTVAIGDGANDVAMILSADVGIGIIGKEGVQASRAADFGVTEFRSLRKLLLVHGREALRRNSFVIYYGIFKNIAFCVASFCFQFFCGFSGQDIYNFWFKSLYATVFVAPTVLLYATFDRELPHYILNRSPITYHSLPPVMWPIVDSCVATRLARWLTRLKNGCCRFWGRLFCCGGAYQPAAPRGRVPEPAVPEAVPRLTIKKSASFPGQQRRPRERPVNCWRRTKPRHRTTVPVGVRSYGTRLFLLWVFYGLYVGVVICILPLWVLNHATSVDRRTFRREMSIVSRRFGEPQNEAKDTLPYTRGERAGFTGATFADSFVPTGSRTLSEAEVDELDEGKSGFDLEAVGMVVMFQCILICNLIVLLAINSLFLFQALLMIANLLLFVGLWAVTMWQPFITDLIPGLNSVAGMFKMIWSCTVFYFCVFISTFVCITPVFTARVFKMIFEPNVVTIIKERMLQGVFDIVVGRRQHGAQEIVVFVPQRQPVVSPDLTSSGAQKSVFLSRKQLSPLPTAAGQPVSVEDTPLSSLDACPSTWGPTLKTTQADTLVTQPTSPSESVSPIVRRDPYTGFAFGYDDTLISSPPSLWTLATLATWAGRTVSTPLIQISRGVGNRFLGATVSSQHTKQLRQPVARVAQDSGVRPTSNETRCRDDVTQ